jgi:hypothetical protein
MGSPILPQKSEQCPACKDRRVHTDEEWEQYHPEAGRGYSADEH